MMTPKDVLISKSIFVGHEMIGNISCAVGYIKRFRLQWFATQLNSFVFIGEPMERIDRATIESFSSDCLAYALDNHKGWPRGLQSGVCSIAILQGWSIDQEAQRFCESFSKKHWSAFEVPVLYQMNE